MDFCDTPIICNGINRKLFTVTKASVSTVSFNRYFTRRLLERM